MKKLSVPSVFLLLILSACTWVKPTSMGSEVVVADRNDKSLTACESLGSLTTMVKHTIGSFERSSEKVDSELTTLAQNEAVEMGGDTIAAEGPAVKGRKTFTVYKCRK